MNYFDYKINYFDQYNGLRGRNIYKYSNINK